MTVLSIHSPEDLKDIFAQVHWKTPDSFATLRNAAKEVMHKILASRQRIRDWHDERQEYLKRVLDTPSLRDTTKEPDDKHEWVIERDGDINEWGKAPHIWGEDGKLKWQGVKGEYWIPICLAQRSIPVEYEPYPIFGKTRRDWKENPQTDTEKLFVAGLVFDALTNSAKERVLPWYPDERKPLSDSSEAMLSMAEWNFQTDTMREMLDDPRWIDYLKEYIVWVDDYLKTQGSKDDTEQSSEAPDLSKNGIPRNKPGGYTAKELCDEAQAWDAQCGRSTFQTIRKYAKVKPSKRGGEGAQRRYSDAEIRELAKAAESQTRNRNWALIAKAWRALIE